MCGIAGIISDDTQKRSEAITHRLQTAINHRGPDDRGVYQSPDQLATLIHTRLSILDLTSAGHQPMSSPDGRHWITFNGEIYNFQHLRTELQNQGEVFKSHSDTEVLIRLYQRYGPQCLDRLQGMYAFAIWDEQKQSCFLARDPLGIKPLYYWHSGATLVFASEVRAVLASGLPSKQLNPEGLYGYLLTGSVPEPHTLIDSIHCLPAGHWLSWKQGNLKKQQYWQVTFEPNQNLSLEDATQVTHQALLDSVQAHFVSDVPVGVFLSGGLDSSSIVALARQVNSSPLKTYSIAFEEEAWNEGETAKKVAGYFQTEHTEYKLNATLSKLLLPQFLQAVDQPSIDGFNTFCISKVAAESGSKVVLSGLGGDELFGGYTSFQKIPQLLRWGKYLQTVPSLKSSLAWILNYWTKSSKGKRLADYLDQDAEILSAYTSFRGIFSRQESNAILENLFPSLTQPQSIPLNAPSNLSDMTINDQVSALELIYYMRNQLLRDSDVMSMNWGLELRVPLVDRLLFEALSQVPSSIRLLVGKQLLVKAVGTLPGWLINQPKRGFSFPYDQWIEKEWKEHFNKVTAPKGVSLTPWYRPWSLFILQHWLETLT